MISGGRAAFAAAMLALLGSRADAMPPPEAFGSLPVVEMGRLSPDGTHLAVIHALGGRRVITIYDLNSPNATLTHSVGIEDSNAVDVFWPNNDRVVCVFAASLTSKFTHKTYSSERAISVTPDGQNAVLLMGETGILTDNIGGSGIVDFDPGDPDHLYMVAFESNGEMNGGATMRFDAYSLNLFRVSISTGGAELVDHGNPHTTQFILAPGGRVLGRVDQDEDLRDHVIFAGKEVASYDARGGAEVDFAGMTADAAPSLVVSSRAVNGTEGLYAWTSNNTVGQALFSNANYDITSAIQDERTQRIIGATYIDDMIHHVYFDPRMQHIQSVMEKAFPGQNVTIQSVDAAFDKFVIYTEGPKNPPVLSLYTTSNGQVNIIDTAYPSLAPADLGEVKPYPYKARDGLDIHAYLTLPPGRDPHNLPTVILPHGGPEDRDYLGFDWWAQFLASRGYAVLQPNFRGSAGYGWDFVKAGDGEWASKVQFDVQDGVKKLIADGIADPKRICIVGGSYGGYMALAGATFSPDLYACAVSYAGVSDISRLLYTGNTFETEDISIMERRLGAQRSDTSAIDAQSPAKHAAQVRIPILLIHSNKDTTVPIEQSEIERDALKSAGKPVEFVELDGDDHHLAFAATRIQFLKEMERFLAAHIGGNPPAQ